MGAYHNTQNDLRQRFRTIDILETLRSTWNNFGESKPKKGDWLKKMEPALGVNANTLDNYFQIAVNSSDKIWSLVKEACEKYPDTKITNLVCIRGVEDDVLCGYFAKLLSKEKKDKKDNYTYLSLSKDCSSFKTKNLMKVAILKILKELKEPFNTWEMLQASDLGSFFTSDKLREWELSFNKATKKNFVAPENFRTWIVNNIAKKNSKLRPSTEEEVLVKNGVTWQIISGDALSFTLDKGLIDVSLVIADLPYGMNLQKWDTKDWQDPDLLGTRIYEVNFHGSMKV